jgi:hypothetical protein
MLLAAGALVNEGLHSIAERLAAEVEVIRPPCFELVMELSHMRRGVDAHGTYHLHTAVAGGESGGAHHVAGRGRKNGVRPAK